MLQRNYSDKYIHVLTKGFTDFTCVFYQLDESLFNWDSSKTNIYSVKPTHLFPLYLFIITLFLHK